MRELVGAQWIGRPRAVVLAAVALAAVVDLLSFVALVGGGDPAPGADDVAYEVVQAVADDDCSGLGDLIDDETDPGELPPVLTSCLDGVPNPNELTDVRVVDGSVDDDTAAVTVTLAANGQPAEVVVDLRRDGDRWVVTDIRAG